VLVPEPPLHAAVPDPADLGVDLRVVEVLEDVLGRGASATVRPLCRPPLDPRCCTRLTRGGGTIGPSEKAPARRALARSPAKETPGYRAAGADSGLGVQVLWVGGANCGCVKVRESASASRSRRARRRVTQVTRVSPSFTAEWTQSGRRVCHALYLADAGRPFRTHYRG
jgi:hypothetical protein